MKLFRKKKGKVTSLEFGEQLFSFHAEISKKFFRSLRSILGKEGAKIKEEFEIMFLEEVLIISLWAISKAIPKDEKSLEKLREMYVVGHCNLVKGKDEKKAIADEMRSALGDRLSKYGSSLGESGKEEYDSAVKHMIHYLLQWCEFDPLRFKGVLFAKKLINDIMNIMAYTLDFRGGFEILD
jgi:hypothetical protein